MIYKLGISLLVLLCCASGLVWSEELSDPTRPPPGVSDSSQTLGSVTNPQVRGLQSVIMSPEHCAAIIDGKTVALGATHGNEKLVEVNERGVVLQSERGQRSMSLFPTVGVKMTAPGQEHRVAKCKAGQSRHIKSPAQPAGMKE